MWKSNKKISQRRGPSLVGAKKWKKNPIAQRARAVGAVANKGPELKFYDLQITPTVPVSSSVWSTISNMFTPVRGDDATEREGRSLSVKSILMRWNVSMTTTSAGGGNFRIVVIYDKSPNGALPAVTDIFQNNVQNSPLRLDYKDRFICLVDEYTPCLGISTNFSLSGKIYRKLNLQFEYNGNNFGDISDQTTGALYLLASQNGGVFTTAPTISVRCRTRFQDN